MPYIRFAGKRERLGGSRPGTRLKQALGQPGALSGTVRTPGELPIGWRRMRGSAVTGSGRLL